MTGTADPAMVSVIIPTFNRAYCVADSIDSALNQTHRNIEVIVVDDGSNDGTRDLVRSRYAANPRVRYFYQSNAGVASARNVGLLHAQGAFVAFLDSDDLWLPWKLALQLKALALIPREVGMIWTDMMAIGTDGSILKRRYLREMYKAYRFFPTNQSLFPAHTALTTQDSVPGGPSSPDAFLGWGDIYSSMVLGNLVHTSTVLLRRSRQLEVGVFDERLRVGEDVDYHLRTCAAGPVAFLDLCSAKYRVGNSDQLTARSYSVDLARNNLTMIDSAIARDRARIQLSAAAIRSVLSGAHAWVGAAEVAAGNIRVGREFAWRALSIRPFNFRAMRALVRSFVPARALDLYRALGRRRDAVIQGLRKAVDAGRR
jgi:GT2 family glycosyltransferase